MTSRIPIIKLAMTTTAASAVPLLFSKWNRVHCESKEDPHKYMVSRRIKEISKEYNIDAMDVVAGVCVCLPTSPIQCNYSLTVIFHL